MPASSCANQAWAAPSYNDTVWQMSWGESSTIAAANNKEDKDTWRPQTRLSKAAKPFQSHQLPGFQPVGFMMTTVAIEGQQCQVPAMVFASQDMQPPQNCVHAVSAERNTLSDQRFSHQNLYGASAATSYNNVDPSNGDGKHSREPAVTRENFDGEFPSVGSEGHFDGSCKRCAFFPKGRCQNGKDCTHCHFSHELRPRIRKRVAGARRRTDVDESAMAEDDFPEDVYSEEAYCQKDVLSEVLSYLTPEEHSSESKGKFATTTTGTDHTKGENVDAIAKFNNALEQVAQAYKSDKEYPELTPTNSYRKMSDADTTSSSVSAHSDAEESEHLSGSEKPKSLVVKNTVEKAAQSDSSDSEVSASKSNESTASLSPATAKKWKREVKGPDDCMAIAKKTRSLLNKLTQERFESLCSQLLALPLSTSEHLAVVVAEIFLKATTQDFFRSLYTEMCLRLDAHLASQTGEIGGKAFRKALVNECQATFERNLQPLDAALFKDLSGDELFEAEVKLKTRCLGNLRFIGDLLVQRLLAPKLLAPILHELLNSNEAGLESLIALLTVVAPEFEQRASLYQAPVRDAFATLRRKMSDKAVCPRMCCMIKDLFDAKERGWAARSATA